MLVIKIVGLMILIPLACVALVVVSVIILSIATAVYDVVKAKEADRKRLDESNND